MLFEYANNVRNKIFFIEWIETMISQNFNSTWILFTYSNDIYKQIIFLRM